MEYNPILCFMAQASASSSSLFALAARWRVLGLMAVMFARRVSLMTKMRSDGASEAAMLEAFLYRAIIQISRDIAIYSEPRAALTDEERQALQYLDIAYTFLMVLALLMRQLRADFESAAEAFAKLAGAACIGDMAMPQARARSVAAIDSS